MLASMENFKLVKNKQLNLHVGMNLNFLDGGSK